MIGKTISHYRILSELGSGGMGVVYRAEDLTLGRQVAIKFLPPHLSSDVNARQRFVHEAKAAATLDHPGICTVYDFGECEGQLFIAMALLEGMTLKDRLEQGPLPLTEALDVAAQAADALHEAHVKEVVHRDIKPANIMLTPKGQTKVMDFGLAQQAGVINLTQAGSTLGTAAYMSPEQSGGEAVDHRTDIWSLGVVVYEMVSGRRPFEGEHEAALMYSIQNHEPTPLTALRTGVPMDVEQMVGKCLAKDPSQRYQHADEIAADRRRLQTNLDSTRTLLSTRKPHRSWQWFAWVALVAVMVFGGGLWIKTSRTGSEKQELTLAILDFQNLAEPEETLTSACLTNLVQVGMVEKCPIRVLSPEYVKDVQRRLFGETSGMVQGNQALRIAREAGAALLLSGNFNLTEATQFISWSLVETASGRNLAASRLDQRDLIQAADGIIAAAMPAIAKRADLKPISVMGSVEQITTESEEAYRHYVAGLKALERGDHQLAKRELEAAAEADTSFALAYAGLAKNAFFHLFNYSLGGTFAERAWQNRDRLGLRDRMSLEALRCVFSGDLEETFATYGELLNRWPDDRVLLREVVQLNFFYMNFAESARIGEQGLKLFPGDRVLLENRAAALMYLGQLDAALDETRAWRRASPNDALASNILGEIFLSMGMADSASVAFGIMQSIEPTSNMSYQMDLSRCQFALGEVGRAIRICRTLWHDPVLSLDERRLVLYKNNFGNLADYYAETGQMRAALLAWDDYIARLPSEAEKTAQVTAKLHWFSDWAAKEGVSSWIAEVVEDSMSNSSVRGFALAFADSAKNMDYLRDRRSQYSRVSPQASGTELVGENSWLIRFYCAEGYADSAIASTETMMGVSPGISALLWHWRVQALRMGERFGEAASLLEEILRTSRGYYLAHYWLGRNFEDLNRPKKAAKEYGIFLELWKDADPEWPHPEDARRRLAALN